jgi:hypothetical protein
MCQDCQESDQELDKQENTRTIGSPFMDKNKLKALSKDSLLQKLENYPT